MKQLRSQLAEGLNTYCVRLVRLKDDSADRVFGELLEKPEGEVRKGDLLPILLSPLMGRGMPQKERIVKGFEYLKKEYEGIDRDLPGLRSLTGGYFGKDTKKLPDSGGKGERIYEGILGRVCMKS